MAVVTRENIGLLHDKLTVKVTPDDYKKTYEASLKKYSERANVPGFRKGKVPATVLAKMFGDKVIIEEVLKIAERSVDNYVKSEKIDIFFNPLPVFSKFEKVDVLNFKDYSFDFEIGLRPIFDIKPEEINVIRYNIEVPEDLINSQISNIQSQLGELKPKEIISEDEDSLEVILDEVDTDGIILEDGISKQIRLKVSDFSDTAKQSILGLKVDDKITLSLENAFPDGVIDSILEELGLDKLNKENSQKIFNINITNIQLLENAELNEELFAKAYPAKKITSEEELREAVKEEISIYFAEQSRKQMHDQIYHHLVDNMKVDLPEEFILKLIQVGDEKKKTREEALEIYPSFSSQLKWSLLTSQLKHTENIKIVQEDFTNLAKTQILQYFGGKSYFGDDDKWLTEMAEKSSKDKKFVDEHYSKIFADKLFSALEKKLTPTEESIDYETFSSKVHHHHF